MPRKDGQYTLSSYLSLLCILTTIHRHSGTEVNVSLENGMLNFGQHFRMAAKRISAQFRSDAFDSCVVEVGRKDVQEFLEELFLIHDY